MALIEASEILMLADVFLAIFEGKIIIVFLRRKEMQFTLINMTRMGMGKS